MIYTLTRSKRKTIALYVRNGNIEVRAPLRMSKRAIEKFIASKEKWILDKITLSWKQEMQREKFSLDYGDTVICRNKPRQITATDGDDIDFDDERFYIPAGKTPEQIKQACVQIYKMIARRDLTIKTYEFGKHLFVTPTAVKINSAKSRWGSCSAKGRINFSWRLIMADDEVIDYVVVHELAHLVELNHSKTFWMIVERVLPDYKERQKRLKELQDRLGGEVWD